MPIHLAEHLAQYDYSCGIFVLPPNFGIGEMIEDLVLIAEASDAQEYRNFISHISLN